jgi:thioredoxin 1
MVTWLKMANTPAPLTDRNLELTLREHRIVLVYCWSRWCSHCRRLSPLVDELAEEYAGRVLVASLNAEENRRAFEEYQIMFLPSMLLFGDGKLVDWMSGVASKKQIEKMINKHLKSV